MRVSDEYPTNPIAWPATEAVQSCSGVSHAHTSASEAPQEPAALRKKDVTQILVRSLMARVVAADSESEAQTELLKSQAQDSDEESPKNAKPTEQLGSGMRQHHHSIRQFSNAATGTSRAHDCSARPSQERRGRS